MPLHLLRDIPREVRDQIYAEVLSSPYGCVALERSNDRRGNTRVDIVSINPRTYERMILQLPIRLNLLRTCSQIHLEARNILWKRNCLAIEQPSTLYMHSRFSDTKFCYAIESIQMRLDLLDSLGASATIGGALKIFGHWAREGSLRSLTLTMFLEGLRGINALDHLVEAWGAFRKFPVRPGGADLFVMTELGEAEEALPVSLKRKIVFETDWDVLSLPAKRDWMKRRAKLSHPRTLIKEIHDKFGGEFWMDGILWFKDHVEIKRLFDIPPDDKSVDSKTIGQSL